MRKIVKYGLIEIFLLIFLSIPIGQNENGERLYLKTVFMYVRLISILIFVFISCQDIPACRKTFLWIKELYSRFYTYIWGICLIAFLVRFNLNHRF